MQTLRIILVLTFCTVSSLNAESWELAPIKGDKTKSWAAAPNWTWDLGNPMTDKEAKWTVAMQEMDNPELTTKYVLMQKGDIYNFKFGWRGEKGGKDPEFKYLENSLSTHITAGNKQGPAAAIIFTPPKAGKYKVDISGTVYLQNKTAGYVLVTVYLLAKDRSQAKELQVYKLNLKGGYQAEELAENFSFQQTVDLSKDVELAVRVQSVNPGPASAGRSAIRFGNFTVSN